MCFFFVLQNVLIKIIMKLFKNIKLLIKIISGYIYNQLGMMYTTSYNNRVKLYIFIKLITIYRNNQPI